MITYDEITEHMCDIRAIADQQTALTETRHVRIEFAHGIELVDLDPYKEDR